MAEDIFTSLSAKVEKLISMYESERAGSASARSWKPAGARLLNTKKNRYN